MTLPFRCCARLVVVLALAGLTLDTIRAGPEPPQEVLRKLPLSLESVDGPIAIRVPTSTQWQGQKYDVDAGTEILMGVVRNPRGTQNDRELALLQLSRLRTHLRGHRFLDELTARFDDAGPLEKKIILTCFKGSRDARAIPLFVRVLNNEKSMRLRLSAASGLAGWNIRRGVAELVELLDSKEVLSQPVRMPYVRHNASESFRNANARKGWGFRYDETAQLIGIRTDLNDDQKIALHIAEVRKWFADNKHRFPDWKPGDPLPEAPGEAPRPKGSE